MALKILKHDMDGASGLLIFRVRAEERPAAGVGGVASWGSEEVVSIYPRALAAIHGPGEMTEETITAALTRWLAARHEEILSRKQLKERFAQVAHKLAGQTLVFDQES
jgi:hypothetical protein